jgi:hypothetical protein
MAGILNTNALLLAGFVFWISGATNSAFASNHGVTCKEYDEYLLTHQVTPCGPIPTASDPNGVYPYMSYCETSNRPALRLYHFVRLENSRMNVAICPDLGGKVFSLIHKRSNKEILYVPEVIRPTRILPRFYFTAGGIEVSFPISHTPVQNEKVLYRIDSTRDRIYVTCGERELRFGMQWSVEYSLGPDDDFLTQRVVLQNPGTSTYPWMSWSNAALPSAHDTRFFFPGGRVLRHCSIIDTIEWENEGPKTESDIKEMTGYFWITKDANAFGAFTPSLGVGLYHIADENMAPGIKLWSYGTGDDSAWAVLSTARRSPYLEIQGGPIGDQSTKFELKPGESTWHIEFWLPTDRPMDINALRTPRPVLREINEIPLFSWARETEVAVWDALLKAHRGKGALPDPPEVHQYLWAPSGFENLDDAFTWAIGQTRGTESDLWRFHYGSWLAGRGSTENALGILATCKTGVAKVLMSRLLRSKGKINEAANALEAVEERWLQIHPQVIIERDKVLRLLGTQTIPLRASWLSQVDALNDEWVIERQAQLLIDEKEYHRAKELLLSVPFQKIHQTYARTALWKQICDNLGIPGTPLPKELGEDRLARYGAYREFE